jgi:hypothetical protein
MDNWVEIGVFGPAGEGEEVGEPLYVQKHRARSGRQAITVTVPLKPARAAIDPYDLPIDSETNDNFKQVRVRAPIPDVTLLDAGVLPRHREARSPADSSRSCSSFPELRRDPGPLRP